MYRLLATCLLAGCAQQSVDDPPPASTGTMLSQMPAGPGPGLSNSAFSETVDAATKADAVVVGRLDAVDFSASARDNFLTTMRFVVTDVLRGSVKPHDIITVRHILGREPDGNWRWTAETPLFSPAADARMKTGEYFLIFTSAATYRAQAGARNGIPLDGATGAGLGLYRLRGAVIEQTGPYPLPATIAEMKTVLKGQ